MSSRFYGFLKNERMDSSKTKEEKLREGASLQKTGAPPEDQRINFKKGFQTMENNSPSYWKSFLSSPLSSPVFLLDRESLNRFLSIYFKPSGFGLDEFFFSGLQASRLKAQALRLAGFSLGVMQGEEEPGIYSPEGRFFTASQVFHFFSELFFSRIVEDLRGPADSKRENYIPRIPIPKYLGEESLNGIPKGSRLDNLDKALLQRVFDFVNDKKLETKEESLWGEDRAELWVFIPSTGFSDFLGSTVEKANSQALGEDFPFLEENSSGFGGSELYLNLTALEESESLPFDFEEWIELEGAISGLQDYPLYSEDLHSKLKMEAQDEAFKDFGEREFRKILLKPIEKALEKAEEGLEACFSEGEKAELESLFHSPGSNWYERREEFLSKYSLPGSRFRGLRAFASIIEEADLSIPFYSASEKANLYWIEETGASFYFDFSELEKKIEFHEEKIEAPEDIFPGSEESPLLFPASELPTRFHFRFSFGIAGFMRREEEARKARKFLGLEEAPALEMDSPFSAPPDSFWEDCFSTCLLSGEYRILNLEEKSFPFHNCRGEELPGEGFRIYGKILKIFLDSETAPGLLKPSEPASEEEAGGEVSPDSEAPENENNKGD